MSLTLTVLRCPDAVAARDARGDRRRVHRSAAAATTTGCWPIPTSIYRSGTASSPSATAPGSVADTSSNGTFLNRDGEPLGAGRPRTLGDGDRIRLGPYEIEVGIACGPSARSAFEQDARRPDPFGDDPFGSLSPVRYRSDPDGGSLDRQFDAGLAPPPITSAPRVRSPGVRGAGGGFSGPTSPITVRGVGRIPHPAGAMPCCRTTGISISRHPGLLRPAPSRRPAPEPEARRRCEWRPAAAAPAARNEADLLAAFLRGAGCRMLRPDDPAHTMEQLGAALRALVFGHPSRAHRAGRRQERVPHRARR